MSYVSPRNKVSICLSCLVIDFHYGRENSCPSCDASGAVAIWDTPKIFIEYAERNDCVSKFSITDRCVNYLRLWASDYDTHVANKVSNEGC